MAQALTPKRYPYDQWSPDARALDLVGDKWTLLIIRDLLCGPRRFVELQRSLPGISTEQLRSRLARMVADELLTRTRYREVPPRVDYELTASGRALAPVLGELWRWGKSWAWGEPRPGEALSLGALFRLLPALLALRADCPQHGLLALEVSDGRPDGQPACYTLALSAAGAALSEGAPERAETRISAPQTAWVKAISPAGERSELELCGDVELAALVLDVLGAPAPSALAAAAS